MIIFASVSDATVRNLGTYGAVYPIKEKNALEELQRKARQTDMSEFRAKTIKQIENYRLPETFLPRCEQSKRYLVDMTYTTEVDIPNKDGDILYPRGFTFNPLDYIDFDQTIVILDGEDPKQLTWLKNSKHIKDLNTVILITEGTLNFLSQELERPFYYAPPSIIARLQITSLPSVSRQKGKYMEVRQIAIE